MKQKIWVLAPLLVTLTACNPLALWQGGVNSTGEYFAVIPPQLVEDGGLFGDIFGESGLQLQFTVDGSDNGTIPGLEWLDHLYISEIGIRTLTDAEMELPNSDPEYEQNAALTNEDAIESCANGRPTIDFVESLDLYIEIPGQADTKVLLAQYVRSSNGICGFFMYPEPGPNNELSVNLVPYLKNYKITTVATGTAPNNETNIGGLVLLSFDEETDFSFPQPI